MERYYKRKTTEESTTDDQESKNAQPASSDYHTCLKAAVDFTRYVFHTGVAYCCYNESEESTTDDLYQILKFIAENNEAINRVVLKNDPENFKLRVPKIKKDIVKAAAIEIVNAIVKDIGDGFFSILVNESRDVEWEDHMVIVIRYVDKEGCVIERFLGTVRVVDNTALSFKAAIESLMGKHGLSMSSLRGQSYDGTDYIHDSFNGLQSLIMAENQSVYYVHWFAYQLQLTLVAVAQYHIKICGLFKSVETLSNVVVSPCNLKDALREKLVEKIIGGINTGEIKTRQGLNQEMTLKWAGDPQWGSHYGTLLSLISSFSSVLDVLEIVEEDGRFTDERGKAYDLLDVMQCFDFAFMLHLMRDVLGITNELSRILQRKDQGILNAMTLVNTSKQLLHNFRNGGWESLFNEVCLFCNKHDLIIPNMEDMFVVHGRSRRGAPITNLQYYRDEMFFTVIDLQLQELNNRFNEMNTELLLCITCLDPSNSFSAFDKRNLIRFAKFYPSEFSEAELIALDNQIEDYILDMRSNQNFSELIGVDELAITMVKMKKDVAYPLVYLLVKLALILPIATAKVERAFSAMKFVKTSLHDRIGDDWLNDCLVTYIEQDIFDTIDNATILQHFQKM